ncbi:MAG: DNA polymerase III subunit alpha, partial [Hyphomonadaceae bacterium]
KKIEEMIAQRQRFLEGAAKTKGMKAPLANDIFDTMEKFAGYGFNKSHAAAYAAIAYQTAFLKAHHPVEFLAASMSLDIHNTDKLAAFFQEARRLSIKVVPPDITSANADFDVRNQTIIYALGAIKGVGKPAMLNVEHIRQEKPFSDLQDFAERVDPRLVNRRCFEALSRAGAFDALEANRAKAHASASVLSAIAASAEEQRISQQDSLFGDGALQKAVLPEAQPWPESERLDHELESIGFYLSGHPLDDLMEGELRSRIVLADERQDYAITRLFFDMVGVVRDRVEKPARNGGKFAYVRLSDPSGEYELMAPPEVLAEHRDTMEKGTRVLCRVKVRRQDEDIRYMMEGIRPLNRTNVGAHEALCIRLNPKAPLEQIAEVATGLKAAKADRLGALYVEIPLEDERVVTIQLDGRFPVDFGAMAALKAIPGVDQVRPASAA